MKIGGFLNSSLIRLNDTTQTSNKNSEQENTAQKTESLTTAQKALIAKLKARDKEVRAHEAAHIAAGAGVIRSGANFIYQEGPDDKLYAIGGEVSIDTSKETEPQDTINKMEIVKAAALAPKVPSSKDFQVAATATIIQLKAKVELMILLKEQMQTEAINKYANNEDLHSNFSEYA